MQAGAAGSIDGELMHDLVENVRAEATVVEESEEEAEVEILRRWKAWRNRLAPVMLGCVLTKQVLLLDEEPVVGEICEVVDRGLVYKDEAFQHLKATYGD